jgi:hypothetical protein
MACDQGRRRDSGTRNARYATTVDDEALCVSAEQPDYGQYGRVKRRRQRRSGGATFVMMMQAADVRDWNDRAAA